MKSYKIFLIIAAIFSLGAYENKDIENQSNPDVNIVPNNGCENGKQGWVISGAGTLSVKTTATDVYDGKASCSWNPSAAAATIKSTQVLIPNRIAGIHGVPSLWYNGAGGADITVNLKDADGDVVPGFEPVVISNAVTEWTEVELTGVYPNLATTTNDRTLYLEMEAAGDANPIDYDFIWVGTKSIGRGSSGGDKVYDTEVTYSATPAGWSLIKHEYVPYRDPHTGKWRLRFNVAANKSSSGSGDLTVNGVTFSAYQAISATPNSASTAALGYVNAATGTIHVGSSVADTSFVVSGDVAIDSKPTWADTDDTVYLFNNDTYKANYELTIVNDSGGAIPTSYTVWDGETVTGTNISDYNTSTDVWTPSFTGRVNVTFNIGTGSGTGALRGLITRNDAGLATGTAVAEHTGDKRTVSKTFQFDVTEGDAIRFANLNGPAAQNYLTGGDWNKIYITRTQKFSASSSLGFKPQADANHAGLVSYEVPITLFDISSFGNFLSGQPEIRFTRVGKTVTATWASLGHTNTSNPVAAGVVPVDFRPDISTEISYSMNGAVVKKLVLSSGGNFGFEYRDWTGTLSPQTVSGDGSASWVTP